ncbi:MAG TPA: ArsA family ATPase [Candidatus Binatia bacterium]|nr:ArsA family ATPase [Candidatus Binatia bacterium]
MVVGKGGVGKTTVACALGLEAARMGKRTVLAEVDGSGRAAGLFGAEPASVGEAVQVRPNLHILNADGKASLEEYLALIIPIRRLLDAVFASRIYNYFVAAAPGLKELMTIGKIWWEAERLDEATGRRRWDLVILDAPATGHSVQYLRMPQATRDAFSAGWVARESQRVVDLLTDPHRTAVNFVTTAEEMPVNETIEMYRELCGELHMPPGMLFVNRVHRVNFHREDLARVTTAAATLKSRDERALLQEVVRRGHEELGWAEINTEYLKRLSREVDLPRVELPYVFAEEFGLEQVRELSRHIETVGGAVASKRAGA